MAGYPEYEQFLRAKMFSAPERGFVVSPGELHPWLRPTPRDIAVAALRNGRYGIFANFGLHKTSCQLEIMRIIGQRIGGRQLIVLPLDVRHEFARDARELGIETRFIRSMNEASASGLHLTNYEAVRDGRVDPREFTAASLDEASVLRGMGGTKTFREFMRLFDGMRFKFVATATPSPNEYIEILAYAAFLEIMDVGQAKTRFFKRDPENADNLEIHPHKVHEFRLWCLTWGAWVERPSDLGHSDEGYALPALDIHWHEVASDYADAGEEKDGQQRLVKNQALGVVDASREKRDSIGSRVSKLRELLALDPEAHHVIWHHLEDERRAIERAFPSVATVYGSQDQAKREDVILRFSDGQIKDLGTKPEISGSGSNFQRYCWWQIFLGITYGFNDFIQAVHRLQRYGQTHRVRLDLIHTENERRVREELERKWAQHNEQMREMSALVRQYGLDVSAISQELARSIGVERQEQAGGALNGVGSPPRWHVVNNDCVLETRAMESASCHLIVTSIPFSTQYEYTPSYNDFGHTDSNEHFWQQMDFLIPELLRVLQPGRFALIHVKDRIVPGGMTGLGFQTVYPFHCDAIRNFEKHGFAFVGQKTIVTDVVRENKQTRRLGWSRQCIDGTCMGWGMSEYLLGFRRPPSDPSNSYADVPVVKSKAEYSRGRWQFDAHGLDRSSGNRRLMPEDLHGLRHDQIFRLFRRHSLTQVYDFEHDVRLAESLDARKMLPPTFMLLQPQSHSDEVWTDITRMRTLNGAQSAAGREKHLCPLQFDIVDRAINRFTMRGETVYDPFVGLGTVVERAVKLGRVGRGTELNPRYFEDAVFYCRAVEEKLNTPSLFDALEAEMEEESDRAPDEAEALV